MSLPSDNSQPPLRAAAAGTTVFREREQEGEDEDNDDGDDDDDDDEDDEKKEGKEMRMSLGNNRPALRFWLAGFEDICRTWVQIASWYTYVSWQWYRGVSDSYNFEQCPETLDSAFSFESLLCKRGKWNGFFREIEILVDWD